MSGRGAFWDTAVERFFGSLKNEWLLNIYHLTLPGMKEDVEAYIRYYNQIRPHTVNDAAIPALIIPLTEWVINIQITQQKFSTNGIFC